MATVIGWEVDPLHSKIEGTWIHDSLPHVLLSNSEGTKQLPGVENGDIYRFFDKSIVFQGNMLLFQEIGGCWNIMKYDNSLKPSNYKWGEWGSPSKTAIASTFALDWKSMFETAHVFFVYEQYDNILFFETQQ